MISMFHIDKIFLAKQGRNLLTVVFCIKKGGYPDEKNMKKTIAMILALVMVFALACSGMAYADDAKTVGISMPTKSLERWNRDGTYLKEQFEAAGFKVELTYSDNDAVQQNNDIANMIADGVDVLVITAIDSATLSQTLADAADAGIVVIAYDRLIENADVAYYVSFDNYTVGVLQAQYVIKALDLENAGDKTFRERGRQDLQH